MNDDINRWRDMLCSWIGKTHIAKMTILSKVVYRFNVISIKLPMIFITEVKKKSQKTPNRKKKIKNKLLRKQNGAG